MPFPSVPAYIDPGSGSFLLQAALGSVFGSILALRIFWKRWTGSMRGFFRRRIPRPPEGPR